VPRGWRSEQVQFREQSKRRHWSGMISRQAVRAARRARWRSSRPPPYHRPA
jgi:hypothetical protein